MKKNLPSYSMPVVVLQNLQGVRRVAQPLEKSASSPAQDFLTKTFVMPAGPVIPHNSFMPPP